MKKAPISVKKSIPDWRANWQQACRLFAWSIWSMLVAIKNAIKQSIIECNAAMGGIEFPS